MEMIKENAEKVNREFLMIIDEPRKCYKNIKTLLDDREFKYGDIPAIRYMEGKDVIDVPAAKFYADFRRIAFELRERGFHKEHIAICATNSYEWMVAFNAIAYSANTAVLIDAVGSPEMIAQCMEKTDCKALIYNGDTEASVCVLGKEKCFKIETLIEETAASYPDGITTDQIVNDMEDNDTLLILFTSGTTGDFKAVDVPNIAWMTKSRCLLGGNVTSAMALLPFHHLAGFSIAFSIIASNRCLCIGKNPGLVFRYLKIMKAECMMVVPAMLEEMRKRLSAKNFKKEELGWSLCGIVTGGAKFDASTIHDWNQSDISIIQIYSASELCGCSIFNYVSEKNADSIGQANDLLKMRIKNGELQISGDIIMKGYYGDSEATAEVMDGEWYCTGDLARVDEEGYYYLTGRKKNLIILSNGENVSPEGIEMAFNDCEEITECMVVEKNDRLVLEVYAAELNNVDSERTDQDIKETIFKRVEKWNMQSPGYKTIYEIIYRDEPFTKTAIGKIKRRLTVEEK